MTKEVETKVEEHIPEMDNSFFSVTKNAELNRYELVFKLHNYPTSAVLLNIISMVHQWGVKYPHDALAIGAKLEEKKSKLIIN